MKTISEGRKPRVETTEEQKLWAVAELEKGVLGAEIARALGVSESAVYNWRRFFERHGTFTPTVAQIRAYKAEQNQELASVQVKDASGYSEAERVRIVTAYEDGDLSAREIRDRFGVAHGDLLAWRDQLTRAGAAAVAEDPRQIRMFEAPCEHPDTAQLRTALAECERLRGELQKSSATAAAALEDARKARLTADQVNARLSDACEHVEKLSRELQKTSARAEQAMAERVTAFRARDAALHERDEALEARDAALNEAKQAAELRTQLEAQRAEIHQLRNQLQATIAQPTADPKLAEENERLRDEVRLLAQIVARR